MGVCFGGYSISLLYQIAVPIVWSKVDLLQYILIVLNKSHLLSLIPVGQTLFSSYMADNRKKIIAYSLAFIYGLASGWFLPEPLEDRLRRYIFAETAPVLAKITESGKSFRSGSIRIEFEYAWEGKTYKDFEDMKSGWYAAQEQKLKKGKTVPLHVSKRFPCLYELDK